MNMPELKGFSDAGVAAILRLLDALSDEAIAGINVALQSGGKLALCLETDIEGGHAVRLELTDAKGTRHTLASVAGTAPNAIQVH